MTLPVLPTNIMTSPLGVVPFAVGITAKLKDYGVQGEWNTVACVLLGAFATYMIVFQPSLWNSLSLIVASGTAAGWYSLLQGFLQKSKVPSQG